jgi:hypothetical protein
MGGVWNGKMPPDFPSTVKRVESEACIADSDYFD